MNQDRREESVPLSLIALKRMILTWYFVKNLDPTYSLYIDLIQKLTKDGSQSDFNDTFEVSMTFR